ncbi:MAG: methylenetetrahydrofolate reductase [Anaerolineae bacterium]|nr:methylenetetrahydrofolate reductase [Anaerolineae bacterium]
MKAGTNLEAVLAAGHFAVTGELGPPKGADAAVVTKKIELLRGYVDAVNLTDNQTAVVRMSSIGAALLVRQGGLEPVMQMTCRDRNRLAIQADILGAYALGIRNVLCLTGDHQSFGNHPQAKNVYDLDSIHLIKAVRDMRDRGVLMNGEEAEGAPRMFVGAAANPFADPFDFRPYRLAKKVAAGADFIQTQLIYNVPKFREYMTRVGDLGLTDKVYILAGVGPIKSVGAARYMANNVPGMDVPDEIVRRMSKAPREKRTDEGINICVEVIQQVREIPGVAGVHIMAIEWEEAVSEITSRAGLLPRPELAQSQEN